MPPRAFGVEACVRLKGATLLLRLGVQRKVRNGPCSVSDLEVQNRDSLGMVIASRGLGENINPHIYFELL